MTNVSYVYGDNEIIRDFFNDPSKFWNEENHKQLIATIGPKCRHIQSYKNFGKFI